MQPMKLSRFLAGVTQVELSKKTKISQSALSRIENGKVKPNKKQKKAIAKALDAPEDELFFLTKSELK